MGVRPTRLADVALVHFDEVRSAEGGMPLERRATEVIADLGRREPRVGLPAQMAVVHGDGIEHRWVGGAAVLGVEEGDGRLRRRGESDSP